MVSWHVIVLVSWFTAVGSASHAFSVVIFDVLASVAPSDHALLLPAVLLMQLNPVLDHIRSTTPNLKQLSLFCKCTCAYVVDRLHVEVVVSMIAASEHSG